MMATPRQVRRWAKAMRRRPTKHELILRRVLFAGCAGVKFETQKVIAGYIADFCSPEARLVVEVDGKSHESPKARLYDANRDRVLAGRGYRTLRFTNAEVVHSLPQVVASIATVAAERL